MKAFSLPYGKGFETVALPEDHVLYDLHGQQVDGLTDEEGAVAAALQHPIGSAPLQDIVKPTDTVTIVVSDITRLVHTDRMLPVIAAELNRIGVKDEQITVLISQGTHRAHTPEEDEVVCGKEMARRFKIVQHDCWDKDSLAQIGTTSHGNDVWINKAAVEADKLILTGAVSFHPMAGFGGGRKAVLPGVAGFDTIMYNHALALAEKQGDGCNQACEAR